MGNVIVNMSHVDRPQSTQEISWAPVSCFQKSISLSAEVLVSLSSAGRLGSSAVLSWAYGKRKEVALHNARIYSRSRLSADFAGDQLVDGSSW